MTTSQVDIKTRPDGQPHRIDEFAASLADDPLRFIKICWPQMQIYDKQREILLSVRDNIETFAHTGNELGKTRSAALLAIWFFVTRTPARVICSSSSESQLNTILFNEIRHLISTSEFPLPLVVNHLSIRKLRARGSDEIESLDYLVGHVTNQVESFQGHHLPNDRPRVLSVFDESSGIADEFYEAANSWAHRVLAIGNPLSNHNFFFRNCKRGDVADPAGGPGLLRKVIHVDGIDSPNVQLGMKWNQAKREGPPPVVIPGLLSFEEYLRREQTWDEVQRRTRLHGHFYEGEQAMLFPAEWIDAAMDRDRWLEIQYQDRRVEAIGVDVAAGGRDNTCWTLVDRDGVIDQLELDLSDTMQIVGRTLALIRDNNLSSHRVAIDAGGGGKQIADRLAEQGFPVLVVGFGESADAKQTFRNRRSEMYGLLRERLKTDQGAPEFLLPPDADELRRELTCLPLLYDSEGRLILPPKSRSSARPGEISIEKLLGGSPDRADSLVLAIWVLDRHRGRMNHKEQVYCCEDDSPLTPEEIDAMPDELREIYQMEEHLDREYRRERLWRE